MLILREVLEFPAGEVARILDTTPAAVNSALQRARKAVDRRIPGTSQQTQLRALGRGGRRELVDALVAAWERADVLALLDLLAREPGGERFTLGAVNALTLRKGRIVEITGFLDPDLHRRLGVHASGDRAALAWFELSRRNRRVPTVQGPEGYRERPAGSPTWAHPPDAEGNP